MPTVSKEIADRIVAKNGQFEDDPLVVKIVVYDNLWGGIGYGLVYQNMDPNYYMASHYVRNPRIYWEVKCDNQS